jgi:hypothetical protein
MPWPGAVAEPLRLAFVQTPAPEERERLRAGRADLILRELDELHAALEQRGVPVEPFHPSDLSALRQRLPSPDVFVAADLGTCWSLLAELGRLDRVLGSYPAALDPLLRRHHWRQPGHTLAAALEAHGAPLFVKPVRPVAFDGRRWRGQVVTRPELLRDLHPALAEAEFLCAEAVDWLSEYRCYVLHGEVVGIHPYRLGGAAVPRIDCTQVEQMVPALRPDVAFVDDAVARLEAAGAAAAGYALDIGLTERGELALVELNDALALMNYGLSPERHLDLLAARWHELMLPGSA